MGGGDGRGFVDVDFSVHTIIVFWILQIYNNKDDIKLGKPSLMALTLLPVTGCLSVHNIMTLLLKLLA